MSEHKTDRPPESEAAIANLEWGKRGSIILVPLDGSLEAKAALPMARLIAEAIGGVVHVLRVGSPGQMQDDLLHTLKLRRREETLGLVIEETQGEPAAAIIASAKQKGAALIAMTTRGVKGYDDKPLRQVPERVVEDAPCPVLLVRPELAARVAGRHALRHIVLPLDGTPSALAAIGPAVALAYQGNAQLDMLYIAQLHTQAAQEPGTLSTPRYIDQPQYEWPAWVRECLDRCSAFIGQNPAGRPTRIFVRHGEPAAEILGFATENDADLVALDWRGRADHGHAEIVYEVVARAPCPVLLLHPEKRPSIE